jgi:bacteriocin-like protein
MKKTTNNKETFKTIDDKQLAATTGGWASSSWSGNNWSSWSGNNWSSWSK